MTNVYVGSIVLMVNQKCTWLESTTINKRFKPGCFLEIFFYGLRIQSSKNTLILTKKKSTKALDIFVTALSLIIN